VELKTFGKKGFSDNFTIICTRFCEEEMGEAKKPHFFFAVSPICKNDFDSSEFAKIQWQIL
jgi:hypothetical protein